MSVSVFFYGFYKANQNNQNWCVMFPTEYGLDANIDRFARLLGFENIENYIDSYPDKFEDDSNSRVKRVNINDSTFPFCFRADDTLLNIALLCVCGSSIDCESDLYLRTLNLNDVIYVPTIKEFVECNDLKQGYYKNDGFWFCRDWKDD